MSLSPIEMLQIIRQHGDLSLPEFVARSDISPMELVEGLEKLQAIGLLDVKDPAALTQLHQLATEVEAEYREASTVTKRRAFFGQVAKAGSVYRHTKLQPTHSALVA